MLLKLCDLSERIPHCGDKCFEGSVQISTKNIDPFSSYDVHRLEKHSFEKIGFKRIFFHKADAYILREPFALKRVTFKEHLVIFSMKNIHIHNKVTTGIQEAF